MSHLKNEEKLYCDEKYVNMYQTFEVYIKKFVIYVCIYMSESANIYQKFLIYI